MPAASLDANRALVHPLSIGLGYLTRQSDIPPERRCSPRWHRDEAEALGSRVGDGARL